jgi:ABC-type dipeptide/oligopeptide/nickel transport system permease component
VARYIARRLLQVIPVLIGVSLVAFGVLHLIPGDPAAIIAGPEATEVELAAIRRQLGLDAPLPVQYVRFLEHALQGDLGVSLRTREPVIELLVTRIAFTFQLTLLTMAIAVTLGVVTGVIAATKHNTWIDSAVMLFALVGLSIPSFWLGLMGLILFAATLGWLPSGGAGGIEHLILPAVVLGASGAAVITRMTRSSMLEVIGQDYIRTLRAMGVPARSIVFKHALRNALNPVITVVGLEFGSFLAGTTVVETVFSLPGVGRLMVSAIFNRDYAVIQGGMLVLALLFVFVNLATDLLYAFMNPRIRFSHG